MHIFYNVRDLDLETRKQIINEAFKVKTDFWVDKLDCSESFHRQKIDMSFEEIMDKFDISCHFVVIDRDIYFKDENHGEVGFCTKGGKEPIYYLWINTTVDDLYDMADKFNLAKNEL